VTSGNKLYKIAYFEAVVKEDIPRLSSTARIRIKRAIEERLMTNPAGYGKSLRHSLKGHRRLRVGDYRVVYWIESKQRAVHVVAIKHRREVYD